ncbi:ParB/RepB/Spo0J family partition protein [Streptomyces sp. WAC06614]|uniref:ParB/RepB/Spo0J family partition protein n=1 Tax=Streptomyces sp. WAC06614 TaxID=2487416 RepID=UPI000F77F817|nr:ParB/RepB/Spo0J family partition protein [Streptomyces sp. WAC06614]RSS81238.1 ParB/RepB/Spo0J family partition protein [Streptomyces sp. WAC06614]
MSKADRLGGSATFDAVAQPMSSRAAAFARFSGQDSPAVAEVPGRPAQGLRLRVSTLAHNPYNPREELQDIEELADSVTARGLIQPVTVVSRAAFLAAHPGHEQSIGEAEYVVVDGNRRLAASNMAGLDDVPAHLDDSLAEDADTLLETALVAAVQHKDLEPIEQAKALERLVTKYGSQRQVAKALHKSSGWVTQRLALLKLTPELQQAVEDKSLPVEVARRVGQLPQQQQHDAAEQALRARSEAPPRRQPQPDPGAYAVSTRPPAPAAPAVPEAQGAGEAAGESAGAYAVSTSPTATPGPGEREKEAEGPTESAYAVSTPTEPDRSLGAEDDNVLVDIRKIPRVPWHDGNGVADLVFEKMDDTQRTILLERLLEAHGTN